MGNAPDIDLIGKKNQTNINHDLWSLGKALGHFFVQVSNECRRGPNNPENRDGEKEFNAVSPQIDT